MATETLPIRRPGEFQSRVCGVTGLTVDLSAERLIKANAVTAIVFLLIGGVAALMVAMTRWPAVGLLSSQPELFYRFLTAHGINMLIFWIVFFEVAGLYFGSAILLNARLVKPRLGWFAFAAMLAGAVLTDAVVFAGKADVMWDAYIPLEASPLFYLGYDLFAVGAFTAVGLFFATIVMAKVEGRFTGSLRLVTFGLVTAGIIALVTLIDGVIAFVPAFFWSIGVMDVDAAVYRFNLWLFGHPSQQINLAAMVSIWYLLAALTTGAKPVNEKLSRFAFVLYILFIDLGSVHHLLVDPGLTRSFKTWNTRKLTRHGILRSYRGRVRGYALARSPRDISVREVLEAIEGPDLFQRCVFWSDACSDDNPCLLHDTWRTVRPMVADLMERVSLQEVATHLPDGHWIGAPPLGTEGAPEQSP